MGKIPNGILGGVSGKVAGVVGGTWKGINFLRGYFVPTDPQTPSQMTQRGKMVTCSNISKYCLESIIQPFWNPLGVHRAGIHVFNSVNLKRVTGQDDYVNILLATGALEGVLTQGCEYNSEDGSLYVSWYSTYQGDAQETDNIILFWYDEGAAYGNIGPAGLVRSDEHIEWNIGVERNANNLHVFMFAYRGTSPDFYVSDSIHDIVIPEM